MVLLACMACFVGVWLVVVCWVDEVVKGLIWACMGLGCVVFRGWYSVFLLGFGWWGYWITPYPLKRGEDWF